MQGEQQSMAIFCYAFRVLAPGPRQGSGFTVNVFDSDALQFTSFRPGGRMDQQLNFMLPPGTRRRILGLIAHAGLWLGVVPPVMGTGREPMTESRIGFSGYPIRIVQDLPVLAGGAFRSLTGHNARILYNLLEDVASILFEYGFYLQPDGFTWRKELAPVSTGGTKRNRRVLAR